MSVKKSKKYIFLKTNNGKKCIIEEAIVKNVKNSYLCKNKVT